MKRKRNTCFFIAILFLIYIRHMRASINKKTFRPIKSRIPQKHVSEALWKSINKSFIFENKSFIYKNKSFNYKNKSFGFKNKSFILSFTPMSSTLSGRMKNNRAGKKDRKDTINEVGKREKKK